MKRLLIGAAALALAAPLPAQHMAMPGMTMPMPARPHAKKKPAARKALASKTVAKARAPSAAKKRAAAPVKKSKVHSGHATTVPNSSPMSGMSMPAPPVPAGASPSLPDHSRMGGMAMPAQPAPGPSRPVDHAQAGAMAMPGMDMGQGTHAGHAMAMSGALGPYPMTREASGTSWQPDSSEHTGLHVMSGEWTLMAHGLVNLVYDHQSGPRGDDKAFASGMLMGMASRPLGNGTVQFKAMVSPEPLMGARGYPLLLASGETANGTDRLIDRQHPHDLFIELSASASHNIGPDSSIFIYGGLPGEPAFGPPAFMHREAIMDSPEAPISHHWLDSTHISFGVLTAGVVLDRVKLEVSRFNGREPDQHRWNIETGPLDSTAIRLSWNPARTLSLQGSWGHFKDPEQLEPGVDQKRLSASALWAAEVAPGWKAAATLAWGRKTASHHDDDALAAEASLKHSGWTLFGRAEMAENRELLDVENGPAYRVGKVSVGAIRDVRIAQHVSLGAGGLVAVNFVPDALAPLYGGHDPLGTMAFVRLKLD